MLIVLRRGALEGAIVRVQGAEVRLYDAGPAGKLAAAKLESHAEPERALAAGEKIVARRVKAGWTVLDRIESPWVAWLGELETVGARIAATAEDVGVSVDHRLTIHPRASDDLPAIDAGYRDLARSVSFVRHHYLLWRDRLRFKVSFELRADAQGIEWAKRQWEPDQTLERGALGADGVFEVRGTQPGDETLRYESAEIFRERFLDHVRSLGDAAIQTLF